MEKRKLASIQCIRDITPIEGADRIECVSVLGWKCVANKGQFHIGDQCIYFEVDSFLPICDQFEFLRKSSYKKTDLMGEGFRLKTITLKGQISQGLVQPLSILPKGDYKIGDDVTDILGVRKWDIEERDDGFGRIIGEFPSDISKTDELRVQSYPELIEEFKKVPEYYISTKMDGTSVTMYWKNAKLKICGRKFEYADDDKCILWKYAHDHKIAETLLANGVKDVAIQGEYCGPDIHKNRLKLVSPEWYVFTVIDLETGQRFPLKDQLEFCEKNNLTHVPIEEIRTVFDYDSIDKLLKRAEGRYSTGNHKEGIVIRSTTPMHSDIIGGPLSMKVINNIYLAKE